MVEVLTIGHSTHAIDRFLALLRHAGAREQKAEHEPAGASADDAAPGG